MVTFNRGVLDGLVHSSDLGERDGPGAIGLLMQLNEGELRGPVDANEKVELTFLRPNFGDVDVKEADRVRLELLLCGLVPFDLREPADAVSLQAAMQGPRQMGNGRLQTVVEGQEGMAPECDDDRLLLNCTEDFGSLGPVGIGDG